MSQKKYYSNGCNKYYCRTEHFSSEAPYTVAWQVWCNERNAYTPITDPDTWMNLENTVSK